MGKAKAKKKGLSDLKNAASAKPKKATNPFEVHVNRQKFEILGRKIKTDRGLPGLARAKSIKRRRETLLPEYKLLGKSNKFVDRRIGEFNKDMTAEDKIMARFTAERASSHRKKAMFNLADDEPLTHKGRSIMELETFEDPVSDGDDDHFNTKLDGKFVEEAHFGGGMLKKTEGSRMAVIDQLIADSKMRKAEKAAAKEQTLAATEKLDKEWKDLLPVLAAGKPAEDNSKRDDYDKLLGQLKFEPRGTPSNRLKTESEVAEAEAKRLRELEEDRLRRMAGEDASSSSTKRSKMSHRSADDLDDGFNLSDEGEEEFFLTYDKEGRAIGVPKDDRKKMGGVEEEEYQDSDEGGSDDDSDDEDNAQDDFSDLKLQVSSDDENDSDTPESTKLQTKRKRDAVESKKSTKPSKNVDSEDEVEDEEDPAPVTTKKKKLKTLVEPDDEETSTSNKKNEKDESTRKKVSFSKDVEMVSYNNEPEEPKTVEELDKMRQENEKLMETARSELPFTFLVPNEYEEFKELFKDKTLAQKTVIIERMIKCTHPSLKEGNREKLEILFTFILQTLNDMDYEDTWTGLDMFAPYLFDLSQFSPAHAAEAVSDVIAEKFSEYMKKKSHYPYPDTLVFLKLVPMLFPPSDKRHQVTTPSLIFILSILNTCKPNSRRGISTGLFLCALLTQYVCLSKRIAFECISYLNGILQMSTPKTNWKKTQFVGPFLSEYKFLCLSSDMSSSEASCKMSLQDVGAKGKPIDDDFRVRAVFSALTTLNTLCEFYSEKDAIFLLLEPIYLSMLSFKAVLTQASFEMGNSEGLEEAAEPRILSRKQILERYPPLVKAVYEETLKVLENIKSKPIPTIIKDASKPKTLKLYEPNIKPVYDKDKIADERIRLKRRIKKESKGVLREIRKDRSFIAGVRFRELKASDNERIRKVKEIYGWGAQQQGELNKLDRIKRRKKFKR